MALTATQVQQAYIAFFNRPADPGGLAHWMGAATEEEMIDNFGNAEEFFQLYDTSSNQDMVVSVYSNLFGREPDAGGLEFWTEALDSGRLTIAQVALTMLESAGPGDDALVENKVAAASAFTAAIEAGEAEYSTAADVEAARDMLTNLTATSTEDEIEAAVQAAVAEAASDDEDQEPTEPGTGTTYSLQGGRQSVAEDGTVTFTVTSLAGAVAADTTVGWTITGLDAEDVDGDLTGTVTIPAGQESATFTVTLAGDEEVEGDETMTVTIDGDPEATVNVTVTDDDGEDPGVPGETFTLTAGVDDIDGTANNDTFRAVVTDSLETFDIINGMEGTDRLNIDADGLDTGPVAPVITSVEQIYISDTDTLDLDEVSGVQQIWAVDAAVTLTNASVDTVFGMQGDAAAYTATYTVGFASDLTGDTDVLTLALDNTGAGATIASGDAAAFEGLTIMSQATAEGASNTVDFSALTGLTTVAVTGEGDTALGTLAAAVAGIETFDASAATGDVSADLSNLTALTNAAGGAGADALTVATAGLTGETLGISANAGIDTVTLAAGTAAANITVTVALGAGTDTLEVTALTNIADATEDAFADGIVTVTDFNVNEDVLDIDTGVAARTALTNTQLGTIEGADTLYAALQEAADVAQDATMIFNYGGNTYVYQNLGTDNDFDAGDGLLALAGVNRTDLDAQNLLTA